MDVVFDLIQQLRSDGMTILVVEQNARLLLDIADRAIIKRTGTVAASGHSDELRAGGDLFDTYLGAGAEGVAG